MALMVEIPFQNGTNISLKGGYIGATYSAEGDVISWRYRVTQADGSAIPEKDGTAIISPLGSGGFGAVVRATDGIGISRAVKFVSREAYYFQASAGKNTNLFDEEIRLTNAQPFKNVVTITDYGAIQDEDGKQFIYYISPFVDGVTLDVFTKQIVALSESFYFVETLRHRLHDQVLRLISDILAALAELTEAQVLHMDLKPTNILIHPRDDSKMGIIVEGENSIQYPKDFEPLKAFVIDLGAGKSLKQGRDDMTILLCTAYYFPMHLLKDLGETKIEGVSYVRREKLRSIGQLIDLYAAGKIFEEMLFDRYRRGVFSMELPSLPTREYEASKEALWSSLFGDDFEVLQSIVDNLIRNQQSHFKSAAQIKKEFETLAPKSSLGILNSEILTDKYPGIQVQTRQALVKISKPFSEIIDHPCFQRLRLINQLSFVSEVFPEATHNRFTHSIRSFHLAKQFLWGLNRKGMFRFLFNRQKVDELLASALLHDLGQYSFSHSIEDLRKMGDLTVAACKPNGFYEDARFLQGIKHDQELAEVFINDEKNLQGKTISDVLIEHGLNPENICYAFRKTDKDAAKPPYLNIARDLISGVFDVDRVSYLLQDSDQTGVLFGGAINVESLIDALTIRWERNDPTNLEKTGLALEEKGLSAAESILMAVYWMYKNIYWRRTNRAFMAAIKFVFCHLLKNSWLSFDKYIEFAYKHSDLECLRFLHKEFEHFIKQREGEEWFNPLRNLVSLRRIGYRRVSTIRLWENQTAIYTRLVRGITPERERKLIRAIKDWLPRNVKARHGDILIDVPLKKRFRHVQSPETQGELSGKASPVWVALRNNVNRRFKGWAPLAECSPIAKLLQELEDHSGRKIRVFFSRELLEQLEQRHISLLKSLEQDLLNAVATETEKWSQLY